jgi:hypothetical protein
VADFNQDGISMPADSTVARRQPSDSQSELSVSRKVKISIVLLLMLCTYFLMEDRPRPATPVADAVGTSLTDDLQIQGFSNDLAFLQTNDAQQPASRESQAGPLTVPDPIASAEPYQADSSSTPPLAPGLQQIDSPAASAGHVSSGDKSHSMPHQSNPPEPVPTIVRFTGRIETLR